MEPGKLDFGPGHHCAQARNEIQRLKNYVRGTIPLRRLQRVSTLTA